MRIPQRLLDRARSDKDKTRLPEITAPLSMHEGTTGGIIALSLDHGDTPNATDLPESDDDGNFCSAYEPDNPAILKRLFHVEID